MAITTEELIAAVRAHATKNYELGWDVIIECWTDNELAAEITGAKTAAAAIRKMRGFIQPVRERGTGELIVRYTSIDHVNERRRFKTLAGARKYAQSRIGEKPTIATWGYAVSDDGVGKVEALQGCTLAELFPQAVDPLEDASDVR